MATLLDGNRLTLNQQDSETSAGLAANGTNTTVAWDEVVFKNGPGSLKMTATAAGSVEAKTGFGIAADAPDNIIYRVSTFVRAGGAFSVKALVNWIDAAGTATLVSAAMTEDTLAAVGDWRKFLTADLTPPAGTVDAQIIWVVTGMDAGEVCHIDERYFGPATLAPANAGADQSVAAGATVTLAGTPKGGTWSQVDGTAVTLEPVASDTSTNVTFSASNPSTTASSIRTFRYAVNSTTDDVIVTAAAATTGATVLASETFAGADGAAWPTGWTITAAGGGAVTSATQQTGRGRMTLPGTAGYPSIAAVRRDVSAADVEIEFEVGGTFDATNPDTAEHYREVLVRLSAADPATGLADSYYLSITPASTLTTDPWRIGLQRRRGGVPVQLVPRDRSIPSTVRNMKGRLRITGRLLQARVWDAALAEPSTWPLSYLDETADAITAAGAVGLVAFGANVANTGLFVDWDNYVARTAAVTPTITATAPVSTVWNDTISLSATGTDYTDLKWTVSSAPAGSTAALVNDTTATPTFTPDKAGIYTFTVTASNFSASSSFSVSTDVRAQMWQRTSTGKIPVRINFRSV